MIGPKHAFFALFFLSIALVPQAEAQRSNANSSQLTVTAAAFDVYTEDLSIHGQGFGSAQGVVTVNGFPLPVSSWTDSEIHAELSDQTQPGSYLMTVARGPGTAHFDSFVVTVGGGGGGGGVGPKGDKGDKGDPGLPGTPGVQGLPGNLALAGMSCPSDRVLRGFDASGGLVCVNPTADARTKLALCGPSARNVAEFVPAGSNLQVVETCTPASDQRAMLVTRDGHISLNAAALQSYLNGGGIVVTEYSASFAVYNKAFGTSLPLPDLSQRFGACEDNVAPLQQLNAADPFWAANGPFTPELATGCGFNLVTLPGVTALGSHSANAGTVTLGYIGKGAGRLWLVESDWTDGQETFNAKSALMMQYMVVTR